MTIKGVFIAIKSARWPIITMALTYLVSVVIGAIMVHTGSAFAIKTRDDLVGKVYANNSDPIARAMNSGNRLQAALIDFGQNLLIGAVPNTVAGLGVLIPYPLAAYRGWVGGIVSIDGQHASRLARPAEAFYYLLTLILQLIPYSLAGGAGVQLGLCYYRSYSHRDVPKWLGLPRSALTDVAHIYLLVVPLFLLASLFEFLAR